MRSLLLVVLFSSQVAHADEHPDEPPPLSAPRIGGEVLVGGLFGFGGALAGAGLGFVASTGCRGEFCRLGYAALGGYVGYVVAAPLGVYVVGRTNGQTGSVGATLGGSALCAVFGLGLALAADQS